MKQFDILEVANRMTKNMQILAELCETLDGKANAKATAIAEYDKSLALAIIKLKDADKYPTTLIEKIAKGECYKERAAAELADADYKLTVTKVDARQAILNGWQSINRHLSTIDQQGT